MKFRELNLFATQSQACIRLTARVPRDYGRKSLIQLHRGVRIHCFEVMVMFVFCIFTVKEKRCFTLTQNAVNQKAVFQKNRFQLQLLLITVKYNLTRANCSISVLQYNMIAISTVHCT